MMTPEEFGRVKDRAIGRRRQMEVAHLHHIDAGPSHAWSAMQDLDDALDEVGRLRRVIAEEINALRFEWRIEGDIVSREKANRLAVHIYPTEETA